MTIGKTEDVELIGVDCNVNGIASKKKNIDCPENKGLRSRSKCRKKGTMKMEVKIPRKDIRKWTIEPNGQSGRRGRKYRRSKQSQDQFSIKFDLYKFLEFTTHMVRIIFGANSQFKTIPDR